VLRAHSAAHPLPDDGNDRDNANEQDRERRAPLQIAGHAVFQEQDRERPRGPTVQQDGGADVAQRARERQQPNGEGCRRKQRSRIRQYIVNQVAPDILALSSSSRLTCMTAAFMSWVATGLSRMIIARMMPITEPTAGCESASRGRATAARGSSGCPVQPTAARSGRPRAAPSGRGCGPGNTRSACRAASCRAQRRPR